MLEAGTSYARLLPRGQTNAGGWDFICSLAAQSQFLMTSCCKRNTAIAVYGLLCDMAL
jgi:hypothetical protein